jgi:hypothetical protein
MKVAELPMAEAEPTTMPPVLAEIDPVETMLPPLVWLTVPVRAASPHWEQT